MTMFPLVVFFVTALGLILFTAEVTDLFSFAFPFGKLATGLSVATPPLSSTLRRRVGRPRKFGAPSRAVTLTLPETVIAALSSLDPDLSRAVVALVKRKPRRETRQPAEVAVFGNRAVITVSPTPTLELRTGMELVPTADGRALITLDSTKSVADLELLLTDALADPALSRHDRGVFEGIAGILQEARRSSEVSLLGRTLIVFESARGTRKRAAQRTGT
jgi:hypothetical protein